MSAFPVLKTGAVMQYPAGRASQFSTEVVQFLDGAEQRFRDYGQAYHRWAIKLSALDETELQSVRSFIEQLNGAAGVFSFTDPWDGTAYPSCSLEGTSFTASSDGPMQNSIAFTLRENRS